MSRAITQFFLAFVLLVGMIFLDVLGFMQKPLNWARLSVNILNWPFAKSFEKLQTFTFVLTHIKQIAHENERLIHQVEDLSAELAELEKSKTENKFLSEALGFFSKNSRTLIPAEVIAQDIFNFSQMVVLSVGNNQGVKEGYAVVASKGILVGVVTETYDDTSLVELITSSKVKVNAQVVPSGVAGITQGEHGLGIFLVFVSQNDKINPGEKVVTSGLGGQFQGGLLIGEILEVLSGGAELFQKASIVPSANLKSNKIVFVLKP